MNSVCTPKQHYNLHKRGRYVVEGLTYSAEVQLLLIQVCEKLWSEFSAYEGFHVIEMGIESCSKGMYACGGERMGG